MASFSKLFWHNFGPCQKIGCNCAQFYPAVLQQEGAQCPSGHQLYGALCICNCPGNFHCLATRPVSPQNVDLGAPPPTEPSPPATNNVPDATTDSAPAGSDAHPDSSNLGAGTSSHNKNGQKKPVYKSFLNGSKDRKRRQQDAFKSNQPKYDPSASVRCSVDYGAIYRTNILSL